MGNVYDATVYKGSITGKTIKDVFTSLPNANNEIICSVTWYSGIAHIVTTKGNKYQIERKYCKY